MATDHVLRSRPWLSPRSEAQLLERFLSQDVLAGIAECAHRLGRVTDPVAREEIAKSLGEWRTYLRANATGPYADLAPLAEDKPWPVLKEEIRAAMERHGWSMWSDKFGGVTGRLPKRAMRGCDVGR